MEDIIIRNATAADFAAIIELISANSDNLEPRNLEQLEKAVGTLWVADHDGKIVGCAMLDIYSPRIAEVRSVAVEKEYRNRGVGRRLVQRVCEEAQARNIQETFALTSAPEIFKRMNFDVSTRSKFAMFLKKEGK